MTTIHPPAPASDPWWMLRELTPARIALGRTGASLPTDEILRFAHAHALARDAVHAVLDLQVLAEAITGLDATVITATSAAADRAIYLRRPDLGRRLSAASAASLSGQGRGGCDVAIVVADGLSAMAIHANAVPLLTALLPVFKAKGWTLAPVTLATQARVALGDDIGERLGARLTLVLIGERPGLSSPDSLGAYLTFGPRTGRRDNERNCVSNVREAGLAPQDAARAILWLIEEAFRRGETGVALKDESVSVAAILPAPRILPP